MGKINNIIITIQVKKETENIDEEKENKKRT